ncbi:hypothetical protein SAY86_002961 [Trapa natans]|uniref:Uncharacterized protein n=1 Tax=Trapa natans TaxID=22666 RepID=A0AAN7R1G8_TRANT|nr:hypothetical protein SAY86_002961 [Trapa natans]
MAQTVSSSSRTVMEFETIVKHQLAYFVYKIVHKHEYYIECVRIINVSLGWNRRRTMQTKKRYPATAAAPAQADIWSAEAPLSVGTSDAGPSKSGPAASGPSAGDGAAEISDSGVAASVAGPEAEGELADTWLGEEAEAAASGEDVEEGPEAEAALGDDVGEGDEVAGEGAEEALGEGDFSGEVADESEGEGAAAADTDPTTARTTMARTTNLPAILFLFYLQLVHVFVNIQYQS